MTMGSEGAHDPAAPIRPRRLALWSATARACPHIGAFFSGTEIVGRRGSLSADAWAGWGLKPVSNVAAVGAGLLGRRMLRLEDGFLRSVGLGKDGAALLSIAVDDTGMFYDAGRPSHLERLISRRRDEAEIARAKALQDALLARRVSKYNTGARDDLAMPEGGVLLVDQVRGDLSIVGALASSATFAAMLDEARRVWGDDRIVVKPHPDVLAGHASGYLYDPRAPDLPSGVVVLDRPTDIQAVLDRVAAVWTVSSQVGFEALIRGVDVTTFGMPFYAGWGLTADRAGRVPGGDRTAVERAFGRRTERPRLSDLVGAALIDYCRYADPSTRMPIEVEGALDLIARSRAAAAS